MFDRVEYLVPGRAKGLSRFFPRKAASPAGQEKHVGFGQGAFPVAPGNFFDNDGGAAVAIDTPHGVQEKDEESPQGDELKAPLGELVVARRRLMAARTDRGRTWRGRTDTSILLWSGVKRAR